MSAAGTTPAKPATVLARAAQANDVKTWIVNEIETLETEYSELESYIASNWQSYQVLIVAVICGVVGFIAGCVL